jgi:hypothetical protein
MNFFIPVHGGQILAIDRATLAVILAGFAIFKVGLRIQGRDRAKARRAGWRVLPTWRAV